MKRTSLIQSWTWIGPASALLLFLALALSHAGLYSFWDDEANTILLAQGVRESGDTLAQVGPLQIAYRNGAELEIGSDGLPYARYVSPLQYFFAAPWVQSFPKTTSPFWGRFPFLLCWFVCTLGLFYRFRQPGLGPWNGLGWLTVATLAAPSWVLFGVQARYYSLTLLFAGLTLELVLFRWRPESAQQVRLSQVRFFVGLGIATSLLFVSNYLIGAAWAFALIGTLALKDPSWVRAGKNIKHWLAFGVPHLLISLPCFLIWNPLGKSVVDQKNSLLQKLKLFYWNLRDLNGTQMAVWITVVGLGWWLSRQDRELRRHLKLTLAFIGLYVLFVSAFSPQPVGGTNVADVRYLYPLMWITLPFTARVFQVFYQKSVAWTWTWVFLFQLTLLTQNGTLQVPLASWVREQWSPAQDPYRVAADLLQLNLPVSKTETPPTLAVSKDYAIYPLMTLMPHAKYVDQLRSEWLEAGPAGLRPDWVLSFCDTSFLERFGGSQNYERVSEVDSVCQERFRPELFWRDFGSGTSVGKIGLYRRIEEKP